METNIKSLPNVSELLKQSLVLYKNNYKLMIGLGLLPTVFAITSSLLQLAKPQGLILMFAFLIISVCAFIVQIIFPIATTKAILEIDNGQTHKDVKDVYNYSIGVFFSIVWIGILGSLVVGGGSLFLIIPGIVLAIAVSFASQAFVVDGKRGMSALLHSFYYTKDNLWGIFWRMLCLGLISFVVSIFLYIICIAIVALAKTSLDLSVILYSISQPGFSLSILLNHILTFITYCVFNPIFIIYSYLIYKNLKSQKPEPNPEVDFKKSKTWFKVLSIISVVVILLSIIIVPIILIASFASKNMDQNGRFTQAAYENSAEIPNDAR